MLSISPVVPAADQAFLKKLQELNLEAIADQLMRLGWSPQQTSQAIMHYRMFLFLVYLHPNIQFVPTQEIDLVWHCHILNTRKYRQDCQMLFGHFLDHEPDCELWIQIDSNMLDTAFAQTQALFEQYFGQAALVDQQHSDRELIHLRHHRSACGRPSSRD